MGRNPGRKARRLSGAAVALHVFTASRFFLALAFALVLLSAQWSRPILWTCVALLAVAELTDLLDGVIARRFGLVSEFGAMLDPYVDSITRLVVFFACAAAGLVLPFVPLVMALRDVTVAHFRIVLTYRGRSVGARWSGKIKAQVQAAGGLLAVLGPFYWDSVGSWTIPLISWVVVIVTAGSVIEYARAAFVAHRR